MTDLPKYIAGTQILTIKPNTDTDAGTFYLQSNELGDITTPSTPSPDAVFIAGVLTTHSGIETWTGSAGEIITRQAEAGTYFITGGLYGSWVSAVPSLGGGLVSAIGIHNTWNGIVGDTKLLIAADATTGGFPAGSLSRLTIKAVVGGAIVYDGAVAPVAMGAGEWYEVNLPTPIALVALTQYNVYFDKTFALATNMLAVTWTETSAPDQAYKLNASSLPRTITKTLADDINIDVTEWEDRDAGDNKTNPLPKFIGKAIQALAIFQNRLVAIQNEDIQTTETDNNRSWFRSTVTQLLATHPVQLRSTSPDSDKFHSTLNHNKDLLLFSKKSQFKLSGEIPLTPDTAGIPQTTSYINNPLVEPASIGKNVYFSFNYGLYGGISKYEAKEGSDSTDKADPITDNIKRLMSGTPNTILGDANLGILYVIHDNEIFVCDYDPKDPEKSPRFAW